MSFLHKHTAVYQLAIKKNTQFKNCTLKLRVYRLFLNVVLEMEDELRSRFQTRGV